MGRRLTSTSVRVAPADPWRLMVAALRCELVVLQPAARGPRRIVVSEGGDYEHRAQIESSWDRRMAAASR